MIDGAPERPARFAGCGCDGDVDDAISVASRSRFLFENMSSCLDEFALVFYGVGDPHFVVYVRSGASASRAKLSDGRALAHSRSGSDENRGKMAVARVKAEAMVDF